MIRAWPDTLMSARAVVRYGLASAWAEEWHDDPFFEKSRAKAEGERYPSVHGDVVGPLESIIAAIGHDLPLMIDDAEVFRSQLQVPPVPAEVE